MIDAALDPTLERLTEALRQRPEVTLAIAFGSTSRGRATFESDVDVGVWTERPLDAEGREALIRSVASATGRPVDLLDLRTTGVPLLRTILREGRLLIRRDRAAYDRLVSRMLADVEDLLPLRERMLRERRARWIG